MCGIAVAIDWPEAEMSVQRLIEGILHRGDVTDPVAVLRKDTAMATRRLRIVDAEHGVQPQISFNARLAVAFNGEIYNYLELRKELADLGVEFRTEFDTEVLANALQVWGYRALERLVGMYAFVAVDLANGEFLAARDPFGVKPLYVIQSRSSFLFCSEMRPLLRTVPVGDVMLLPPGYALSRKNCARFKSPIYPRADVPVHHDPRTLDRILSEAVRTRLPAGLPVATLFSGGIDSTLVAHYTRQFRSPRPSRRHLWTTPLKNARRRVADRGGTRAGARSPHLGMNLWIVRVVQRLPAKCGFSGSRDSMWGPRAPAIVSAVGDGAVPGKAMASDWG